MFGRKFGSAAYPVALIAANAASVALTWRFNACLVMVISLSPRCALLEPAALRSDRRDEWND
jgi:hypothetical protein